MNGEAVNVTVVCPHQVDWSINVRLFNAKEDVVVSNDRVINDCLFLLSGVPEFYQFKIEADGNT